MIRALIAQTNEIDEIDLAVVSILAQLELGHNLLKNSVGLLFCHFESLVPGLLEALCRSLPFNVTGSGTPMSTSQTNLTGFSLLTLVVLTSDDVYFSLGLSEPLGHDLELTTRELTTRLTNGLNQAPKLGFIFAPPISKNFHASHLPKFFSAALNNCPLFGCLSCDFAPLTVNPKVIFNDQCYENRFSLLLFYGLIKPKFNLINIPEKKALKQRAIISKVNGNRLIEVNGIPILDYLNGMDVTDSLQSLLTMPLLVTKPDGETKICMLTGFTSEGHGVCSQDIPLNSTLGLAGFDETDVFRTAKELTEELKWEQFDFCLILSCLGRNLSLGLNYMLEFDHFRSSLGNMLPYVVIYSGGEFCPEINSQGACSNSFSTLALTSCRF
ncbi:MAG: FIST C-terminal domain-containing protein [Deltaproteobacteria bacterium]|jgi:hypothetical protein|nr:FIST C-terminal domain-containing protein [Deltaproteobacteria bacterium]